MTIHKLRAAGCATLLAMLAAGPALSQEIGARPTFADLNLSSGFTPDPYTVRLTAGGTIDAARTRGGSCVGKIASAPDIRLTYTAGSLPINIKAISSEDTTLVINGPDGSWYCDDDSGGGHNPMFHLSRPTTGVYEIWVGTYGDTPVQATVQITEVVN